jgi:hypothetical protein
MTLISEFLTGFPGGSTRNGEVGRNRLPACESAGSQPKIKIKAFRPPAPVHCDCPELRVVWYTEVVWPQPEDGSEVRDLLSVLGRGTSITEAVQDFVRRAKLDGFAVDYDQFEVVV